MGLGKAGSIAAVLTAGAGLALATAALASTLPVGEVGNNRSSATNVDSNFTLDSNANIFDATTVPHASVSSTNDALDDVDWYSFTAGEFASVYIDIDCGSGCGVSFNPNLAVYDSDGTVIAYAEDEGVVDPGSTISEDPFIGELDLPGPGIYYVSVSNYDRLPIPPRWDTPPAQQCNGEFQALTRPDGYFGGYKTPNCPEGMDGFAGTGTFNTGDYILHISNSAAPVLGPNYDGQLSDQPKYRWLEPPAPNPFQAEFVAAPNYSTGPGTCRMTVPTSSTCSNIGSQPGCILVGFDFAPSPPANGFECCGYQAKCELTCPVDSCTGSEPNRPCPPSCTGTPDADDRCWDEAKSDCSPQSECDDEEDRLRGVLIQPPVPDCCFFGRATKIYRWGNRVNETPLYSDTDVFPNQCDNCPNVANDTQVNADGDLCGDACDSSPNNPNQPVACPEPGAMLGLASGGILLGWLRRRR